MRTLSMDRAALYFSKPKRKKKKKHRKKKASKGLKKALRKFSRGLKTNATKHELIAKRYLDELEIKYQFQRIFTVGDKGYIVDFYLPEYCAVIEIDGIDHSEEEKEIKDNNRTDDLLKLPWVKLVIRFDNDEISNMYVDNFAYEVLIKLCPFSEKLIDTFSPFV